MIRSSSFTRTTTCAGPGCEPAWRREPPRRGSVQRARRSAGSCDDVDSTQTCGHPSSAPHWQGACTAAASSWTRFVRAICATRAASPQGPRRQPVRRQGPCGRAGASPRRGRPRRLGARPPRRARPARSASPDRRREGRDRRRRRDGSQRERGRPHPGRRAARRPRRSRSADHRADREALQAKRVARLGIARSERRRSSPRRRSGTPGEPNGPACGSIRASGPAGSVRRRPHGAARASRPPDRPRRCAPSSARDRACRAGSLRRAPSQRPPPRAAAHVGIGCRRPVARREWVCRARVGGRRPDI